jgi:ABC-2 type transport system ATP-binding protein
MIEVENISKVFKTSIRKEGRFGTLINLFNPSYREIRAVEDISFRIDKGESVAYLGPNGAGKSTTIKMLTGVLEPSSGQIRVNGMIPQKNRKSYSYQIGVVFGQRSQLLFDLPVLDSFELLRYMYSIPQKTFQKNLHEFASFLEVEPLLHRSVRTLSLGQRMRCEMIAALLHEPDILFLDEPTIGLDMIAKERIRTFIKEINRDRNVTILLTTHDLGDIESLCPRLIIIDKGTLIYNGSLQYIRERYATQRKLQLVMPDAQSAEKTAEYFAHQPGLNLTLEEHVIGMTFDHSKVETLELLRSVMNNANPHDLMVKDENIEELIRRIYQEGGVNQLEGNK